MPPIPLDLPDPSTHQLDQAPLKLVVCQVRHDKNLAVADARTALAISRDLVDVMGETLNVGPNAQQEVTVAFGPAGIAPIASEAPQTGWTLRSADGAWVVALLPEFFALECTGYTSWTQFRERFVALCRAVSTHVDPAIEMRLGLRYVDELRDPTVADPMEWGGVIDDRFLGPVRHPSIGPSLGGIQQVMQLTAADDMQVLLRHGTQRQDEAWVYLLDTDCFRQGTRPFDPDDILEGAVALHRLSLQLFQTVVTPPHLAHLQGVSA